MLQMDISYIWIFEDSLCLSCSEQLTIFRNICDIEVGKEVKIVFVFYM